MKLREATAEDMMLVFQWANDPEVRRNSFSTGEIPLEEHKKWFSDTLRREDVKLYILTDREKDIGQIRVRLCDDSAEISYSIAAEYRGMGYGAAMISLLKEKVKRELPDVKRLVAEVKPQNTASKKVFLNAGFAEKCSVYEMSVDEISDSVMR